MISLFICLIIFPFIIYGSVTVIDGLIHIYKYNYDNTSNGVQLLVCSVISVVLIITIVLCAIVYDPLCIIIDTIRDAISILIA